MQPIQLLMQLMASKQNPQAIIDGLIKQNPQARVLLNQMQQSGMTPRQYAMQLMKQNNIDLNQIENIAKQNGINLPR